jgi:hypothetical protein
MGFLGEAVESWYRKAGVAANPVISRRSGSKTFARIDTYN